MPGIITLYSDFAESHVELYEKKGKVEKISRAKVELQLLNEIEKAEFPIEYKLTWYHAVLVSLNFDAFWKFVSSRHSLPESCTARYVPDQTLLEYEAPTDDEAEEGAEDEVDYEAGEDVEEETHNEIHDDGTAAKVISPTSAPQTPALTTDHESRSSTPDSDNSSRSSTPDLTYEQEAAIPWKRTLPTKCDQCDMRGHTSYFCPKNAAINDPVQGLSDLYEVPRAALVDVNDLAREEADDGTYEESPSESKAKDKAKAAPTVKGASKPKGVAKKKVTPKKKEQTPAQLKTAAAKTREPAKPKATKKAATTPSQAVTKAVHVPYTGDKKSNQAATEPDELDKKIAQIQAEIGPAQEQGIKRMWEQFPDDEDDSPATKKAKTGGAASANGGRKKATPKKSNKKKSLEEEWDGIPRGFGEY